MTLIEQFRSGDVALYFNQSTDSVEDLRTVLSQAFPGDRWLAKGDALYYHKAHYKSGWSASTTTTLLCYPLSSFLNSSLMLNQRLIQRLRDGQIVLFTEGKGEYLEKLRTVLKASFPNDTLPATVDKYYCKGNETMGIWRSTPDVVNTTGTVIHISNFFTSSTLNQQLIQELRTGKLCVQYTGMDLNKLEAILKAAFPSDRSPISGVAIFYYVHPSNGTLWWCNDHNSPEGMRRVPHNDFFIEQPVAEEDVKDSRFPFKLLPQQQWEIMSIACASWKKKLAKLFGESYLLQQPFTVSEEFYKEMRKACTADQHKLFDKIFGSDNPDPAYKIGDWVTCIPGEVSNRVERGLGYKPDFTFQVADVVKAQNISLGSFILYPKGAAGVYDKVVRPATEEEIKKVEWPALGTPLLVQSVSGLWSLRYSAGDGKWYDNGGKSGSTTKHERANWRVLDINNLPVN